MPDLAERVLVLAPTRSDAAITEGILAESGLACRVCSDVPDLTRALEEGAGAILMTEEALMIRETLALAAAVRRQPPWSDIPILILCGSQAEAPVRARGEQLGNVTLLERPVRVTNLVSALRSAIRARLRQHEIRDQWVALRQAEEQLREGDRRKDEFLAILAHELRNPLAPVRNAAYFLKLQRLADPDQRLAVDMIERQVSQMARLIDDLLDVSRISRGLMALRPEQLEFAEVAEAAVDACRHEVQSRSHTLRLNLPRQPVTLDGDRERLVQVLTNLITNAAKYSPPGGLIEVSATVRDGRTLEVSVKDRGIGIPPEKLREIFELFVQVDRSFDRQGGLGIGLTLVRQLVELHGGTIEARSEGIGQGSEFVARLPVALFSPAKPKSEPVPAVKPRRILAADDNQDAAESLALMLRLSGHDVRVVFDGEEAIRSSAEFIPEVALLDIGMPKMDGLGVARHIRGQSWGKSVYLVALTGWGREEDRQRAREAGFDAHLVKPISPRELNQLLAAGPDQPK